MDGFGEYLRFEFTCIVGEYANVRGQVPIDLHEPQSRKTVKPCVSHLLHDLGEAFFPNDADQCLPLFFFGL